MMKMMNGANFRRIDILHSPSIRNLTLSARPSLYYWMSDEIGDSKWKVHISWGNKLPKHVCNHLECETRSHFVPKLDIFKNSTILCYCSHPKKVWKGGIKSLNSVKNCLQTLRKVNSCSNTNLVYCWKPYFWKNRHGN